MKLKQIFPILLLLLLATPNVSSAAVFGFLGNFDVINDTGNTAHGFEVDLEGVHATDITDTFGGTGRWFPSGRGFNPATSVERYGAPTITEYNNGITFGVKVTYQGIFANGSWDYGTPSGNFVTPGDNCWSGGGVGYSPSTPCDHFGVGVSKNPSKTTYSWLVETPVPGVLANAAVTLPAPVYAVIPAPLPVAQPPVNLVIPQVPAPVANVPMVLVAEIKSPEPVQPPNAEPQFGEAIWVKVFTTELSGPVALEELVGGNAKIKQAVTETEWQLLQTDPGNPNAGKLESGYGAPVGANAASIIRRYEFYKYAGTYKAVDHQALPRISDSKPAPADANNPSEIGTYLGAQNAGANLVIPNAPPPPPAILTSTLPTGIINSLYTAPVAVSAPNNNPTVIDVKGLPAGLSFNGVNITGTTGIVGNSNIVITVTDSITSLSSTSTLVLTINDAAISFTPILPSGTVGSNYSYTIKATGGTGTFTYSTVDKLPDGLIFTSDTLSGTPKVSGSWNITFKATDSAGTSVSTPTSIAIAASPVPVACSGKWALITSFSSGHGGAKPIPSSVGVNGGIGAPGGTVVFLKAPPAAATFDVGAPHGQFLTGEYIDYNGVVDPASTGCIANSTNVHPKVQLKTTSLTAGKVGTAYSATLSARYGITPYTIAVSGTPAGLSFDGSNIIGKPGVSGKFTVHITVTDAKGVVATKDLTLSISALPLVFAPKLPNGFVGKDYSAQLTASGGTGGFAFAASGLPTGLTLTNNLISGKPQSIGMWAVTLRVTDSAGTVKTVVGAIKIAK